MFKYHKGVMTKTPNWFEVDKEGLAKLRAEASKADLVKELLQNAWDTNAGRCDISLSCIQGTKYELIVTDDDEEGFANLSHAYTLFAESGKKGDPEKRGRFNLGEKLVLAMCIEARIRSTKGSVYFDAKGRRFDKSNCRNTGSEFYGILRMTKAEADDMLREMRKLIPPARCATTYNGIEIPLLTPLKRFEVILPTVIGDHEGNLRGSRRKCWVEVYEPQEGQEAMIYEMGIPVVESGDRWHYNVLQKVPLTLDRTNVPPAFLRDIREAVAENLMEKITEDDAQSTWVREAASNPDASYLLTKKVFESRFGENAVIYDPSDMEANKRAMDDGRTVVMGGNMSKEEWSNVKRHGLAAAAGKVYTSHKIETDPDGREWTEAKNITPGMKLVAEFCMVLAAEVYGKAIQVTFVSEMSINMAACYGSRHLRFNVARLGYKAFENGLTKSLLDLIIHELAHERALDHLSDAFHEACTMIGAEAVVLALTNPAMFREAGLKPMATAGC